uniref:Uncharacterized protein n=1 Tax=Trichuris muris TaxID=70415 RepID=A0A5S6QAH0_TRIMR
MVPLIKLQMPYQRMDGRLLEISQKYSERDSANTVFPSTIRSIVSGYSSFPNNAKKLTIFCRSVADVSLTYSLVDVALSLQSSVSGSGFGSRPNSTAKGEQPVDECTAVCERTQHLEQRTVSVLQESICLWMAALEVCSLVCVQYLEQPESREHAHKLFCHIPRAHVWRFQSALGGSHRAEEVRELVADLAGITWSRVTEESARKAERSAID